MDFDGTPSSQLEHRPIVLNLAESDPKFENLVDPICMRVSQASKSVKVALTNIWLSGSNGAVGGEDLLYVANLKSVQKDLWILLGFLSQLKRSTLDFILATESDNNPFSLFKIALSDSIQRLAASKDLTESHPWASSMHAEPPVALSSYKSALAAIHDLHIILLPFSETFDGFACTLSSPYLSVFEIEPNPSFSRYFKELLATKMARVIEPDGVARVGRRMEARHKELGKHWVTKSIEANATPSLSVLESVHLDLLEKIANFTDHHRKLDGSLSLIEISDAISKEVARVRGRRFSIAFCGMVKSGKSLFLNSLIGRQILPSDELPATAWPCRLRHSPDLAIPRLTINAACFDGVLQELQIKKIGQLMKTFQPSKNFLSALADSDFAWDKLEINQDEEKEGMHHKWKDLHLSIKCNLDEFEDSEFQLASSALGDTEVSKLLGKVNNLVRICRIFGIKLPNALPETWAVLDVSFEALKNLHLDVGIEFIDLPGIGEANSDFHQFEDLVRIAASEADSVVPIISLNEVARGDWRKHLTAIVKTGLGCAPDFVLCTHLDNFPVSRVQGELVPSVGKEFWPTLATFEDRVLYCSPRLGFGAQSLMEQSMKEKPAFSLISEDSDYPMQYDCAKDILGSEGAEEFYSDLSLEEWVEALEEQLTLSNLPTAISQLVSGIISNTQAGALLVEGEKLRDVIKKSLATQRRHILEISRSEKDYQVAYNAFLQAQDKLKNVQDMSATESQSLLSSSEQKLEKAYALLEQDGFMAAVKAIEYAANNLMHAIPKSEPGSSPASSEEIVLNDKFVVEKLYYAAQDHMVTELKNDAIRKFVAFVRELADWSRAKLFELLVSKLELVIKDNESSKWLVEDILERLPYGNGTVAMLYSSQLKYRIVRTDVEHHNVATAYTAFRNIVSKPFLKTGTSTHGLKGGGDLGFMFQAPIAVLAAIPLVLGSPIWPFVVHRKKFIVDKATLAKHFQEEIQTPFFLALKKEAEITLDTVIHGASLEVQEAVDAALKDEERLLEGEESKKKISHHDAMVITINTVSLLWNLLSAEAGLFELQSHLM